MAMKVSYPSGISDSVKLEYAIMQHVEYYHREKALTAHVQVYFDKAARETGGMCQQFSYTFRDAEFMRFFSNLEFSPAVVYSAFRTRAGEEYAAQSVMTEEQRNLLPMDRKLFAYFGAPDVEEVD